MANCWQIHFGKDERQATWYILTVFPGVVDSQEMLIGLQIGGRRGS